MDDSDILTFPAEIELPHLGGGRTIIRTDCCLKSKKENEKAWQRVEHIAYLALTRKERTKK
ncbi:MAG: hypothetical protein LBQ80_01955 [Clostridium sp.]|jgi:hypothetical protein|nr:hypothetical protein [Clostridium sp.]